MLWLLLELNYEKCLVKSIILSITKEIIKLTNSVDTARKFMGGVGNPYDYEFLNEFQNNNHMTL